MFLKSCNRVGKAERKTDTEYTFANLMPVVVFLYVFVFISIQSGFSQNNWLNNELTCIQRIKFAKNNLPNDTLCLQRLCSNPVAIANEKYLLCDSCCIYLETKVLNPNPKNKTIQYDFFLETGFKIASFIVNIEQHQHCKVSTFKDPNFRNIALPRGGAISINMYEALQKIGCIRW